MSQKKQQKKSQKKRVKNSNNIIENKLKRISPKKNVIGLIVAMIILFGSSIGEC